MPFLYSSSGCRFDVVTRTTPWDISDSSNLRRTVSRLLAPFSRGRHPPSEDHGVGDVGALKLVEAQHVPLLGDVRGHKGHGVDVVPEFHLHAVQPPVYVLHEVVEVYPRLGLDGARQRLVEEVHQHGLAAAHVSEKVEPPRQVVGDVLYRRLIRLPPEPRTQYGRLLRLQRVEARVDDGARVVVPKLVVQVLETLDDSSEGLAHAVVLTALPGPRSPLWCSSLRRSPSSTRRSYS